MTDHPEQTSVTTARPVDKGSETLCMKIPDSPCRKPAIRNVVPEEKSNARVSLDVDALIDKRENRINSMEGVIQDPDIEQDLLSVDLCYQRQDQPFAEGGQARIFAAKDRTLCRTTAMKTLKDSLLSDPTVKEKFIREAQMTSQLDHPSIIPIYALCGDAEHGLHITMKLIRGSTLKHRMEQIIEKYENSDVRKYDEVKSRHLRIEQFLRICDAVSYAHSKGVLHCDLKPENIMIGEYYETYVTDWGIARRINSDGFAEIIDKPGTISGTPRYISPENVAGEKLDCRSDVFSLGLILFELITLSPGTVGDDPKEIMVNTRDGIMNPVVHRFGVPIDSDLKSIILKATATDREKRYRTVEDFSGDLRRYMAGIPVLANPLGPIRRTGRWITGHVTALTITALLFGVASAVFSFMEFRSRQMDVEKTNSRDKLIAYSFSKFYETGSSVDRQALDIESFSTLLATKAAYLFQYGMPRKNVPVFDASWKKADWTNVPDDLQWAPAYNSEISLKNFCALLPDSIGDREPVWDCVRRISPILETFRNLFSRTVRSPEKDKFIREDGCVIRWMNIGFENGIFIAYPGTPLYPKGFDPRLRPWYRASRGNNGPVWGTPYMDSSKQGLLIPCSVPISNNGDFLGTASIDVSVSELDTLINSAGNSRDYAIDKILLSADGRILLGNAAKAKYEDKQRFTNDSEIMPKADDELLKLIKREQVDYFFRKEQEIPVLYFYMKLHAFPGYYIEKIDFRKLRAHTLN